MAYAMQMMQGAQVCLSSSMQGVNTPCSQQHALHVMTASVHGTYFSDRSRPLQDYGAPSSAAFGDFDQDMETAAGAPASTQPQPMLGSDAATRVLFSCCKGETHTHRAGFKQLFRRLRSAYRPDKLSSADDIHPEVLLGAGGASPAILVLGCPTQRFSTAECDALVRLVAGGGGLLVLLGEGGEAAAGTNINYVLEQFGIAANADAVLRTSHHKYMHPKEALVVDGLLNRSLLTGAGGGKGPAGSSTLTDQQQQEMQAAQKGSLEFVYPYGCTLTVQRPAVPLLASGRICYPMQRPLAAAWEAQPGSGGGRILVIGSAQLFDDRWLDKEANARIMDWAFKWLRPVSCRMGAGKDVARSWCGGGGPRGDAAGATALRV